MQLSIAIIVPLAFMLISMLSKKLTRAKGTQDDEDYHFGTELCLASLSSSILYVLELYNQKDKNIDKMGLTVLFLIFNFLVFLVVIYIHKENKDVVEDAQKKKKRRLNLWLWSNLLGLIMYFLFIFIIKNG